MHRSSQPFAAVPRLAAAVVIDVDAEHVRDQKEATTPLRLGYNQNNESRARRPPAR